MVVITNSFDNEHTHDICEQKCEIIEKAHNSNGADGNVEKSERSQEAEAEKTTRVDYCFKGVKRRSRIGNSRLSEKDISIGKMETSILGLM